MNSTDIQYNWLYTHEIMMSDLGGSVIDMLDQIKVEIVQ